MNSNAGDSKNSNREELICQDIVDDDKYTCARIIDFQNKATEAFTRARMASGCLAIQPGVFIR